MDSLKDFYPMSLDYSRIRGLCFDVDGTLADTDDQAVARIVRIFKKVNSIFPGLDPLKTARRLVMGIETPGNFLYSIPDILGLDDELAWFFDFLSRNGVFRSKNHFWLVPQVPIMLQQLSARYPMTVVSARDEQGTQAFLKQFGLEQYFRKVITAHTCLHTKPFPDPILFAAEVMNLSPRECLMIGDTTVDIQAARRAGAQSVGVLCGFGEEKELLRAGADFILTSTPELTQLLLSDHGFSTIQEESALR
jgi:phosphoglycolate phosphatase-like HAD superfamily hydrolase